MFSEAYKNLCELHKEKLRKEWEQGPGDWVFDEKYGLGITMSSGPFLGKHGVSFKKAHIYCDRKYLTWLPTPRQLMRMLEERGYEVFLRTSKDPECSPAYVDVVDGQEQVARGFGPDPETALLLTLMEVMKDA